jgi:hypothetical protein
MLERASAATRWGLGCTLTALALAFPREAHSCSGPCSTPELWDIDVVGATPGLTANFGLLSHDGGQWRAVCEEAIGGVLLGASADPSGRFVSTVNGLFLQSESACEFSAVRVIDETEGFLLDFSLPARGGESSSLRFALTENLEQQQAVLRADVDLDFESVHVFQAGSAYSHVTSGGTPVAVFATGYTFDPRTWQVAFSLDAGDTWSELSPELQVDNVTLVPVAVDPWAPQRLYLRLQGASNLPAELWRFDAESESVERVLTLDRTEAFAGLAVTQSKLYVAGRETADDNEGTDQGSLYAADRADPSFEQLFDDGPPFGCLGTDGEALYTCVNNFTRDSEFLLARSDDEGGAWVPLLELEELGTVASCGAVCEATTQWLHGTFGVLGAGGSAGSASSGGGPAGAGAESNDRDGGSGCHVAHTPQGAGARAVLLAAAFAGFFRGFRRGARQSSIC